MKIILKQEVKNLGKEWDLVTVADGYARNYLLPRNLAMPATQSSVKDLERRRAKATVRRQHEEEMARSLASRLDGVVVTITARSGPEGRLYGSVTPSDIAEFLAGKGFEIDRRQIETPDPIRTVGDHHANIHLYSGVDAHLRVQVLPEGGFPAATTDAGPTPAPAVDAGASATAGDGLPAEDQPA